MKAQELRQEYMKLWIDLKDSIKSFLKEDEEVIWGVDEENLKPNEIHYEECNIENVICDEGMYNCWVLGVRKYNDSLEFYLCDIVEGTEFWYDYIGEDNRLWILEMLENIKK